MTNAMESCAPTPEDMHQLVLATIGLLGLANTLLALAVRRELRRRHPVQPT